MDKTAVSPRDRIQELVSHFLLKARRAREADPSDVAGTKPLMFLAETLEIIGAPAAEWDRVADFPLERVLQHFPGVFYTPLLSALATHVSTEMCERIREHFVRHGELRALVSLLRLCYYRRPDSSEIRNVAEYCRKTMVSSSAPIWQELLEFSVEAEAGFVVRLHEEVQYEEESDSIPF